MSAFRKVPTQNRRVRLVRTPEEQAQEDQFLALYGEWKPLLAHARGRRTRWLHTPMVGSRRLGHRGRDRLLART